MKSKIEVVKTLLDALPFIKKFADEKIVIKYGGSAQTSPQLKESFAQDIVLLHTVGMQPIVVHGGGSSITKLLADLGVETKFVDGQRVTTREVMRIAEMVLSGEINKEIAEGLVEQSLMVGTILAPVIGYDQTSNIAKEAFRTGETIREIVLRKGLLNADELDSYLNFREMTEPHG